MSKSSTPVEQQLAEALALAKELQAITDKLVVATESAAASLGMTIRRESHGA